MSSEDLYQDWVSTARRADDLQTDFEVTVRRLGEVTVELDQLRGRAEVAEAERDGLVSALGQMADRTERAEAQRDRMRATLPGLRNFLDHLAQTASLPVRSTARMWSNTLGVELNIKNDYRVCEFCGSYWCGRRDDYTCTNAPAGGDDA